jgi:16S rRNA (guanine966-N2)-methyltransferase
MRVIAGKFKKANLVTVKGKNTRPTTDYLKEVIFSVTGNSAGKIVLDLFAGSGALGLEALSRGAAECVLVDMSDNAIKAMKLNITKLRCETNCRIYKKRVSAFIKSEIRKYDLIFLDPPYDRDLVNSTLQLIAEHNLLARNGKIIVERSDKEKLNEEWLDYVVYDKKHSNNAVTVLSFDREEK